jgi:hypothetical protein
MAANLHFISPIDKTGIAYDRPLSYFNIAGVKDADPSMEGAVIADPHPKRTPDPVADSVRRDIGSDVEEHEAKVEEIRL